MVDTFRGKTEPIKGGWVTLMYLHENVVSWDSNELASFTFPLPCECKSPVGTYTVGAHQDTIRGKAVLLKRSLLGPNRPFHRPATQEQLEFSHAAF
ncbi:hypothetical protein TNCV_4360731 [Trichonephila clavipes]|uniref:Uncharacterized protein n=1 Tax=Trichonephila clavipes TaxID=2585209 RepID=A0A8X6WBP1_TRICX|nr:hypothetical protein TNCV_4360731 [Trichonephila clavipes]